MTAKYIFSLALTACMITSCKWNNNAKPLVFSNVGVESKAEKNVKPYANDIAQLEIPAPLTNRPEQILKRMAYTVSYNRDLRVPNWVAWHLIKAHTSGKNMRAGIRFREDEEVPIPRAVDMDYMRSGYDRGHMCPSGDNKWSQEAQSQSFLFTNACPQDHQLNTGDWNELENQCRRWADEYGDVYIACGPIFFKGKPRTIGKNKVAVPDAFFKVVLCMREVPKAIGFIYRNQPGNRPKGDYVNSIDQIERITGIDFFPALPDELEQQIEASANSRDWNF